MRFFVGQVRSQGLGELPQIGVHLIWVNRSEVTHRRVELVDQPGNGSVLGFETVNDGRGETLLPQRGKEHRGLAVMMEMQQLGILKRRPCQPLHLDQGFRPGQVPFIGDQGINEAQHRVQFAPKHIVDGEKLAYERVPELLRRRAFIE